MLLDYVILLLEIVTIPTQLMEFLVMMQVHVHYQIIVRLDLVLVPLKSVLLLNSVVLDNVILLLEIVHFPTQLMELIVMMEMHAHKQISVRLDLVLVATLLIVSQINVIVLEHVILLLEIVHFPPKLMILVVMMATLVLLMINV
jgi:hypothetical protein